MASATIATLRVMLEVNAAKLESEFEKATIRVKDFDKFTEISGRGLQRMVEQFSGQKIVAEAARMAAAVEKIGGTSQLTERELARIGNTVNEAAAKMKAMGAEVPPGIAKLHAEIGTLGAKTSTSTGFLGGMSGALSKLGPLLPIVGVTGMATALFRMGTEALESASRIVDLSNKTGLSTTTIQQMQHVADQTGTTLEAFTGSAFKLGVNIETGTRKVRDAVKDLGLSYSELASMKPEDQFKRVVEALNQQDDTTKRNAIGVALFGKGFAEIAASVAEGYEKIADGANVSTERQLKSLDKAGDAWADFKRKVQTEVTSLLGTIVQLATAQETGKVFRLTAEQQNLLQWYKDTGKETGALMQEFVRLHNAQKDIRLSTESVTVATVDHVKQLREMQAALKALTPEQRAQIDAALKLTGATDELGDQFGLTKEALRLYEANTRESVKATRDHEQETEKAEKAQKKFLDSVSSMTLLGFTPYIAAAKDAGTELQNIAMGLDANGNLMSQSIQDAGEAQKAVEAWAHANGAVLMPSLQDMGREIDFVGEHTRDLVGELVSLTDGLAQIFGIQGAPKLAAIARGFGDIATALRDYSKAASAAAAAGGELSLTQSAGAYLPVLGAIFALGKAWDAADDKKRAALKIQAETAAHIADIQKMRGAYLALGLDFDKLIKERLVAFHGLFGVTEDSLDRLFSGEPGREALQKFMDEFQKRLADLNEEFGGLLQSSIELGQRLPEDMLLAIEKLREMGLLTEENAALFDQLAGAAEVDWKMMQDAAQKYGVDLASLGQQFQSARLHESAQQIWEDFVLLRRGGADVGGVLFGMREEISQLVRDSVQFGTSIPEQFRPLIEELIRSGNLIDENGNAITNLSTQGLTFGDPIITGFEKIVTKIQELIDKITGPLTTGLGSGIPAAAGAAGDGIRNFAGRAVYDLGEVEDAINRVNFGESPGGLKEIPLLFGKAGVAAGSFAEEFTKLFGIDCVGAIDKTILKFWKLGDDIDGFSLKTWEDKFEDAATKIIFWMDDIKKAIPNEEDMAGIRKGMGDPLLGGIGRGGSGDPAGLGFGVPLLPEMPDFAFGEVGGGIASMVAAAPSSSPVTVQIAVGFDPASNRLRVLTERERRQVQGWLDEKSLTVPKEAIRGR